MLRIGSFAPSNPNTFLTVVSDFADLITNNNFDHVVVDVSGNGYVIIRVYINIFRCTNRFEEEVSSAWPIRQCRSSLLVLEMWPQWRDTTCDAQRPILTYIM